MTCKIIYYREGEEKWKWKDGVERNYGRAGETMITRTICRATMIRPISTTIIVENPLDKSRVRIFLISKFLCKMKFLIVPFFYSPHRNLFRKARRLFRISPRIFALKISVKHCELRLSVSHRYNNTGGFRAYFLEEISGRRNSFRHNWIAGTCRGFARIQFDFLNRSIKNSSLQQGRTPDFSTIILWI